MSKELEALEMLKHFQIGNQNGCLILWDKKEKEISLIEKSLKALEIIKEKNVDVGAIKNCVNAYAYNDFKELTETKLIKREKITQEEFDTVKEVLL